jgi:hypothetical protein
MNICRCEYAQDTKAHQTHDGQLAVAAELDVP